MAAQQVSSHTWTQTMRAIARRFASVLPFVGGKRAPRELWRDGYGGAYGEPRPGWVGGYGHHYLQSEAVFAAVNAFANRIATTEMHLFKQVRDGEQEQMQHEVLDLLNNPNDFLTRTELMWHTASDLKLAGNAYWFLSGPANGRPTGIWRCNPRHMTVARSKEDYISGYVYEIEGEQVPLYPQEVIHFKRPNPFDEFYGLGDIAVAALAARTGHSMANWNRSIFEGRYGVPAGVVAFTDWLNDTQFAQAQKDWLSTYGSGEKRTAFLRGGKMQFQSIGLSQQELDFLNSARWEQEKIYRVFGTYHLLPAETSDDRKLNERMFLEEHAWPLLLYIMEVLTDRLLAFWGPRRGASKLVLKADDIRPRERALDLDERRLKLSSMTFNEARALEGDDPLDGGDEILYVHVQSGTLLPMEQALMPPPPPQLQPGNDLAPEPDEDEESDSDNPQDAEENAEERESAGDEVGDDIGQSTDKAALLRELGQWERFAIARLGKAARPFVADVLPGYLQVLVRDAIQDATDKQGVTRCFALARSLVQGGLDALEPVLEQAEQSATEESSAHEFELVAIACPLCGSAQTRQYADHGGLCVCPECGQTFDPLVDVERA